LLEVAFDEDFPASVFAVPFPAGVEPRSEEGVEPAGAVARGGQGPRSLLGAAAHAVARGGPAVCCLLAPDDPPGWLGLTYVIDPGARNSLHIQQDPSVASGAQDLVAWEHAMVDDVELRIQERGGEGFPHPPRLIFSGPETRGENMKTTTMKTTTPMAAIAALVLASDALPAQADHGRRT